MTDFKTELRERGYLAYTNKGVSMMPLLRQDRDVMVIRARTGPVRKNDAVLFQRDNGQYVLHRVTKILGDGTYWIVGDNCVSGEPVREDQILGILTEVKRDGKTLKCTDRAYLLYVKTMPLRRVWITAKQYSRRTLSKVYHGVVER